MSIYRKRKKIAIGGNDLPLLLTDKVDGVSLEFTSDKLQANAIVRVDELPSDNIKRNSLYGVTEHVSYTKEEWTYNGIHLDATPVCYASVSPEVEVGVNGITYNEAMLWNEVTQEFVDGLLANNLVEVCEFPTASFCGFGGQFDHESKFTNTIEQKSFSMAKTFKMDGNAWTSFTTIALTDEEYEHLSEEQKTDGTIYVIDDLTPVIGKSSYDTLSNKPKLNGITLQGSLSLEDVNVYSRTEINNLLADKGQVQFVDQLPNPPQKNSWYYTKKYLDGTDVPNDKRALYIVLEDVTVFNYMGVVGDIDLSEYYNKQQVNNLLGQKQDSLSNDTAYSTPSDTDNLSDVNVSTKKVKRITFANIWNWIVGKLTANTEKGIQISSGKLGHSNNITVPTAKRILQATYDAQGHITAIENEFNWSNTYNTSAENQLFTRKGANAMYTELRKVTRYTGNSAMSIYNGGGLSNGADYSSEATRTINVVGKSAYFTCHLKYTSSASDAQWVKIGTIPTSLRPANYTTIVGQVYNNSQSSSSPYSGGNEAAGGYVNASGDVYLWVNKRYTGSNYQIRVTAQWFLS